MDPQTQKENNGIKNIEFGAEGIILGIVLILLTFLILNYFNILSLSSLYPKYFGFLPHQIKITQGTEKLKLNREQIEKIVNEKASKAGYQIQRIGDNEDGSGRTILTTRKILDFNEEFGWKVKKLENYEGYTVGIGIFEAFEEIPGSKDLYIKLVNPENKQILKGRILAEASHLSSAIGSPDDITNANLTQLQVDNLDINPSETKGRESSNISTFEPNIQIKWRNLFQKNDVVVLYVMEAIFDDIKNYNKLMRVDKNGIPAIKFVEIRLFGGKDALPKETQ